MAVLTLKWSEIQCDVKSQSAWEFWQDSGGTYVRSNSDTTALAAFDLIITLKPVYFVASL